MRYPDQLVDAVLDAGEELAEKHNYDFGGDCYGDPPKPNSEFIQVMMKHLIPIFNYQTGKKYKILVLKSKITGLKAELKALEKS